MPNTNTNLIYDQRFSDLCCVRDGRCVDGAGRTLLTQTWSNTETFYCQPGLCQNYKVMHQIWRDLQSPKVRCNLSRRGCFSLIQGKTFPYLITLYVLRVPASYLEPLNLKYSKVRWVPLIRHYRLFPNSYDPFNHLLLISLETMLFWFPIYYLKHSSVTFYDVVDSVSFFSSVISALLSLGLLFVSRQRGKTLWWNPCGCGTKHTSLFSHDL